MNATSAKPTASPHITSPMESAPRAASTARRIWWSDVVWYTKAATAVALLTGAVAIGCAGQLRWGAPVVPPGVMPVTSFNSRSTGVSIGPELVLTSHHGTKDGFVTADWQYASVVACDPQSDLALLSVPNLKADITPVAGPNDPDTGSATFYGFPVERGFKAVRCRVDEHGKLSEKAFPGNSGGPLVKDGRVIGIVLTTETVATARQIRAFLTKAGYSRLIPTN